MKGGWYQCVGEDKIGRDLLSAGPCGWSSWQRRNGDDGLNGLWSKAFQPHFIFKRFTLIFQYSSVGFLFFLSGLSSSISKKMENSIIEREQRLRIVQKN